MNGPASPYRAYQPNSPPRPPSGSSMAPLKQMMLVEAHGYAPSHNGSYSTANYEIETLKQLGELDAVLKRRIRNLKIISRAIATLLSVAALAPVSMTLHKYLQTRHIFRDVLMPDGTTVNRNLWAFNSKTWPTYMYAIVAVLSVLFNSSVLASYCRSVRSANRAATVASVFSWIVLLGNLAVWLVAAALYRQQKDTNGKSNDLWGWTCAPAAQKIQKAFNDQINFNTYCTTQSVSWYFGLAQTGAGILSVVIYAFAVLRLRTKKRMRYTNQMLEQVGYQDAQPTP